jgi:hypothetical protein
MTQAFPYRNKKDYFMFKFLKLFLFYIIFIGGLNAEEIDVNFAKLTKGKDATSKIRFFYYSLFKKKQLTRKQEEELFLRSHTIIAFYRKKGLKFKAKGKKLESNSLLWDKFLQHRNSFLPDERFPISNLYFSVSEPKPIFCSGGSMFTGISTIIIWKYKIGKKKKVKYYDVLILYFNSLKFNPKISIHYSTLNGVPLNKVIGL